MSDGALIVAVGASRSGKTAWVMQQVPKYSAVLVWDPEGQYVEKCGAAPLRRTTDLLAVARNPTSGVFAFMPSSLKQFDYWAQCAFVFVRVANNKKMRVAVIAEETSDVTSPAKAPDGWGILLRRGLKYGADLYAITQRPSESDKTAMGNASIIHCCGLQRAKDRQYMADEMDVPVEELRLNRKLLEYIHKDMRDGETVRGRLQF